MTAPDTAVPVSGEVRRQTVIDAAKAYVCGVRVELVDAALRPLGIDLTGDPAAMAALGVLGDSIRFNVKMPSHALLILGISDAA